MKSKNSKDLYTLLANIPDTRSSLGRRHELRFILILVILATMSGANTLRFIHRFIEKNKKEICQIYAPKNNRLPSRLTIGRALQSIDFDTFESIFRTWMTAHTNLSKKQWISIDGKAIGGTVRKIGTSEQDFISLISAFASVQKQVLAVGKINTKKENEIPCVREIVDTLSLKKSVS